MAKNRLVLAALLGLSLVSACAPPGPFLEVSATTGKNTYLPGEDVQVKLSFKNVGSNPLEIAPFPPLVKIARPRQYEPVHSLQYEPVHSFSAGTGSRSLGPGEVTSYTVTWDQRDDQNQQVPYGYYNIELGEFRVGNVRTSWSASQSSAQPAPILILPTEGTMEKTIDVNQSQTVNGITITLERVELSASAMFVYAFSTPPGYSFPPGQLIHAFSEYSIDGGAVTYAGPSGARLDSNGIEHIWMNLDPVPKSARELTFRITRLGGGASDPYWDGPWEFLISLR